MGKDEALFGKHSHGDSRITCIDCGETICSKCLVQCPVGFRCGQCAGKFKSHLIVVSPWILIRTALACLFVGFMYGLLVPKSGLSMWIGWIAAYFIGTLLGKVVHKIAGYKLGGKVIWTVVTALVVGMLVSPFGSHLITYTAAVLAAPDIGVSDQDADTMSQLSYVFMGLAQAAIFVFGILSPVLLGYRSRN